MSASWPLVRLGEVLTLDLDRVIVDPSLTYEMVGVYSFGRGLFNREAVLGANTSYRFFYRLKSDHVVMSQLFGWEGALAISSAKFAGKFVSPQFPTFLCDESRLDKEYLGWLMRRPTFWKDLGTRTKGMGDRRRTLNPAALFACEIPLPPLLEQQRIVVRIEELAAKIEEAKGLRSQAAEQADAVMSAWRGKLFSNENGNVQRRKLGEITERITKGESPEWQGFSYQLEGPLFIRSENVLWGELDLSKRTCIPLQFHSKLARSQLRPKDVLINLVGASIGRCCVVPDTIGDANVNQAVAVISPQKEILDSEYLMQFLLSPISQDVIHGGKVETARPNISLRDLENLGIPLPACDEQRRIVAYLDGVQSKVGALKKLQEETAKELDALLPSILDKAFKGEL